MGTIVNIIADKSELATKRKTAIKLIMAEPYFQTAIDEVRQDIMQTWVDTQLTDVAVREKLYAEMTALDLVVSRLQSYANDVMFSAKKKEEEYDDTN